MNLLDDLEALEHVVAGAPWVWPYWGDLVGTAHDDPEPYPVPVIRHPEASDATMRYVAAARNALPLLIRLIRAALALDPWDRAHASRCYPGATNMACTCGLWAAEAEYEAARKAVKGATP